MQSGIEELENLQKHDPQVVYGQLACSGILPPQVPCLRF